MLGPKSGGDPKGPLPRADIKITYENGEKEKIAIGLGGLVLYLFPHTPPPLAPPKKISQ